MVGLPENVHKLAKVEAAKRGMKLEKYVEEAVRERLSVDDAILSGNTQIDPSLYKRYVEKKEAGQEKGETA